MKFANPAFFTSIVLAVGCQRASVPVQTKTEPAEVAHHVEELDLNTITLTARAEERLAIGLAEVSIGDVQRTRAFGGEVVIPPGQTIIVSAPIAGTLATPQAAQVPVAGSQVSESQPVFRFRPLLTPEREVLTPAERIRIAQTRADVATAQIESERLIESAKVRVDVARIAHDRATQLLAKKAGSQRSLDEAAALLKLAVEELTTAKARSEFLAKITLDEKAGELVEQTIVSPVSGVLHTVDAAPGETVSVGDILFRVVRMNPIWIRVPVYVGIRRDIDTEATAAISEYGENPGAGVRRASHKSAPPSADPNSTSVDLFYELNNADASLSPGQKVAVTLSMKAEDRSLMVPFNAILYDIHGGAWVYEQIAPFKYARRRVAVKHVDGEKAILGSGPPPGTKVVAEGAAELFGTEFGVGH